MDQAHHFTQRFFPGMFPDEPEHAGHELVRYQAPPTEGASAQNRIIFYPIGLVELHWILATPPTLRLSLDELVDAVSRLRGAVADGAFHRLHRPRRWERRRKVDWRVGVNAWAATSGNSVPWEKVGPPELAPSRYDTGRRPSCPSEGYAANQLSAVQPKAKLQDILVPVLTELLAAGGYSGGDAIRASARRYIDRAESAAVEPPTVSEMVDPGTSTTDATLELSTPASFRHVMAEMMLDAFKAAGLPVPTLVNSQGM
jgi:hypothetical protein